MKIFIPRYLKYFLMMVVTISIAIGCSNNLSHQTISLGSALPTSDYLIIEDAITKKKVPINPQRLVTLHGVALESVLALNQKPLGTTLNNKLEQQPDFLKKYLENVEILGSFEEPNLEKILLLEPDLILDLDVATIYHQLSQIAPTVVAEFNPKDSWRPSLKLYAEALDKPEAAQKIIDNYYARLEKFKTQMSDRGKQIKVSVIRVYPQGISFYQKGSFSGSILADAGLARPPLQNREGVQQFISKELISEADADVIFLWAYGDDYNGREDKMQNLLEELKSEPLWRQLKAVQQGKVYQVPDYWIGYGPLAANAVIDDLFKYLLN